MKFSITSIVLAFASTVVAMPPPGHGGNVCGQAALSCCNEKKGKIDTDTNASPGILNNLLGIGDIEDIELFGQCSDLDLGIPIIGATVQDLLNKKCSAQAACCQQSPSTASGLLAISLPCIPINV